MKIRFFAALLLAALAFTVFSGCVMQPRMKQVENQIEDRLDTWEDQAEARVESLLTGAATEAVPAVPAARLTKEEAISIALKDADLTESQVTQLKVELDYDQGRAEYEVDFLFDRWEYDYEIDAETGKILSSDKDFED